MGFCVGREDGQGSGHMRFDKSLVEGSPPLCSCFDLARSFWSRVGVGYLLVRIKVAAFWHQSQLRADPMLGIGFER